MAGTRDKGRETGANHSTIADNMRGGADARCRGTDAELRGADMEPRACVFWPGGACGLALMAAIIRCGLFSILTCTYYE